MSTITLKDCEHNRFQLRGTDVRLLVGPRYLSASECASILREFRASWGDGLLAGYVSPDGWQLLEKEREAAPAAAGKVPAAKRARG